MRNISAASLEKLTTRFGTEPVCIIEVQWQKDGEISTYADKAVEGMDGRIIQLDNIEDVINVSKSGTSQSVNISLDDVDGHLKDIFNNTDIHKKKVWVYQWFTGIPLTDKFLLFLGVIASPVTWKEGDRTLSFSVISQAEDHEVGFSPEEGTFPDLPQSLIGTTWPLVFGTVKKLPAILVDDIPYSDSAGGTSGDGAASVTKDGTGIKDPSLDHRIDDNDKNISNAARIAQAYFIGYLEASFTARKRGELDDFDNIDKGKGRFSGLAKQYLQQGNAKLKEAQNIRSKNDRLKTVRQAQESNEKSSIGVTNADRFPQNKKVKININGALHEGRFIDTHFIVDSRQHPAFEQYDGMTIDDFPRQGTPLIPRQNYFWADAGTPVKFGLIADQTPEEEQSDPPLPVRYIVSATIQVTVDTVFAYKTVGEIKQLVAVPPNLYYVQQVMFGTLPVTLLWLPRPLSSRVLPTGETEGWEDDLWISCHSPVGPNTVDILAWLIDTYTGRSYDPVSFAAVRDFVDPYPMNFAVQSQPNVLSLISDIAYQARCIVWLKNDVFYIKYLAKEEDPVDTITEDDILEQSMEVSYTETEDLTTKYVANWRADYKMSKDFKVILRYNVLYYGLLPKSYDFFCFNLIQLVEKAATFWLIRQANTFKKIKIKVPISKLNIETLDTVTLDFNTGYIANGPIDCVVEEANLDTGDYTIDLTLWVPVRAGEMTKYLFAYMGDLEVGYYFPTEEDVKKGRVTGGGGPVEDVPYTDDVRLPEKSTPDVSKPLTGDPGNGQPPRHINRPLTWGIDPAYQNDVNQVAPEIITRLDSSSIYGTGTKPAGTTKYQYEEQDVEDDFQPPVIYPRTYPGKVVERSNDADSGKATYKVEVYQEGIGGKASVLENVVFVGNPDQDIEPGTGVMVNEVFTTGEEDETEITAYMQVSSGSGNSTVYPGYVQEGNSDDGYTLETWPNGFSGDSVIIDEATAIQISEDDDEIPEGTGVVVVQIEETVDDEPITKYYFYVAVWQ